MKLHYKLFLILAAIALIANLTFILVINSIRAGARKECSEKLHISKLDADSRLGRFGTATPEEAVMNYKKCLAEKGVRD